MPFDPAFNELGSVAARWGFDLTEEQKRQIQGYLEFLVDYNRRTNLTAETDFRTLLLRHVADGLFAAKVLREILPGPNARIADLGAGGGFIGMAVKIAWPQADLTFVESSGRKYDFLNLAALRSGLHGLHVSRGASGRFSTRPFDAVVERALAPLPDALRLALPLTAHGGWVLAYQSAAPDPEEASLKKVLEGAGARWVKTEAYRLPLEDRDRCLAIFRRT